MSGKKKEIRKIKVVSVTYYYVTAVYTYILLSVGHWFNIIFVHYFKIILVKRTKHKYDIVFVVTVLCSRSFVTIF